MPTAATNNNFYVKFENTRENLALLAYLQTLGNQNFVVYDSLNDISDAEKEHLRLIKELSDFQQIQKGWDGFSALPPSAAAISKAKIVVDLLSEKVLKYCAIFLSNDGGVYLQGKFPSGALAVYINSESVTYVLKKQTINQSDSFVDVDVLKIKYLDNLIIESFL